MADRHFIKGHVCALIALLSPGAGYAQTQADDNKASLLPEVVTSASRSEDGTPVFAIEGEVANISNAARDVPTMRAIVKADGKFYTASKEVKVTVGGCG